MKELTKQEMLAYEAAVWELAEAISSGAVVAELAENFIAEKFGFPVQSVCSDVDDTLLEMGAEAYFHALEA